MVEGVRYYVHHIVMAEYLGIHPSQMPDNVNIHHIDENPTNNDISNLALTTQAGHQRFTTGTSHRARTCY